MEDEDEEEKTKEKKKEEEEKSKPETNKKNIKRKKKNMLILCPAKFQGVGQKFGESLSMTCCAASGRPPLKT